MGSFARCAGRWTALVCLFLLACTKEAPEADLSAGVEVGDSGARESNHVEADDNGREQPDATDLVALKPYISELLIEHDRVVNAIEADPSVAADRDNELIQAFLALYEPSSEVAEQLLDAWEQNSNAGVAMVPFDNTHGVVETRLDGELEMVAADEIRIPTCDALRYRKVDADGNEIEQNPFVERWGEATAVRIDGSWVLRRRDVYPQMVYCRTEGT